MTLATFWFTVLAVLWAGFLVLEGFDFGVGMLHAVVGRDDAGRRVALRTIGPVWDGNEVWLIVAGAATFAAFPGWYATMFSSLYLAFVLLLLALIGRGASLEFRGRGAPARWRRGWGIGLVVSSALAPLLVGVALGDLLHGLPIGPGGRYAGGFGDLLTGYGLGVGVAVTLLCLLHGANWLALRTDGDVHGRAVRAARLLAPPVVVVVLGVLAWTRVTPAGRAGSGALATAAEAVAVVAVLLALAGATAGRAGWAFTGTGTALAALVLGIFASLYPRVMVSTLGSGNDLTVAGTAASAYPLTVMTVVLAVLFPLILAYQGFTYYTFRHRVSRADVAPPGRPSPAHR